MLKTTLRLLSSAPPMTFLVLTECGHQCYGSIRRCSLPNGSSYWVVGTSPDAPAYATRGDALAALLGERLTARPVAVKKS